jgi:hypothetical protein
VSTLLTRSNGMPAPYAGPATVCPVAMVPFACRYAAGAPPPDRDCDPDCDPDPDTCSASGVSARGDTCGEERFRDLNMEGMESVVKLPMVPAKARVS